MKFKNLQNSWLKTLLGEETQGFTNKDHSILKKEIIVFFPLLI